jgi:hypothetical protein
MNRFFDHAFFAPKTKTRLSERRNQPELIEVRLFLNLPDGRFGQCLSRFLMPLRECPPSEWVFNEKDLDPARPFPIDDPAGAYFALCWLTKQTTPPSRVSPTRLPALRWRRRRRFTCS